MRQDLVRLAQAGDHDAFAALVRDALARLEGTARLILRDPDRAGDAVQATLLQAWRDVRGLRDPDRLDAWLYRILVRSCHSTARPGRRREVAELVLETDHDARWRDRSKPLADRDEIERAFRRLTQDQRTVLTLVHFADLTPPDASVALGVPLRTAGSRLHGALNALRTAIDAGRTDRMMTEDDPDTDADTERRLRSWMTVGGAAPNLTDTYEAVISATRAAPQRRRLLVPARNRRSVRAHERAITGRRLALAIVAVGSVTLAAVAGLFIVPRLLDHGPIPGVFRPTGDIPQVAGDLVQPAFAVLDDGRVLVVAAGSDILAAVVFDPATDTYGPPISDTVLRRGATATRLQSGLVLLTGGQFGQSDAASVTAALFDPVSETVASTNSLSVARVEHTATLLADGRVLIAGGRHYPGRGNPQMSEFVVTVDSTEVYDPSTGRFVASAPMHAARAGHTATGLPDGTVLIVGGYTISETGAPGMAAAAEVFDPATGSFRVVGTLTTPRAGHSATLLGDGRVLIVGGANQVGLRGDPADALTSAELFDPATGTFTPTGSLTTERAGHSAVLLPGGRVLVAGGANPIGGPRTTEVWDPADDTFRLGPTASVEHRVAVAPVLAGGRVLYAGSGPGGSEVFDPSVTAAAKASATPGAAGRFSPVAMADMPHQATAVRLDDGRILIVGGTVLPDGHPSRAAALFDPASGQVTPTGSLTRDIWIASATRLPDGRVLVVGWDGDGNTLGTTYDPASGTFGPSGLDIAADLSNRQVLDVTGLPDGRLVLLHEYEQIVVFDAGTGLVGAPIPIGRTPSAGVTLADGRILVLCGTESNAVIVDPVSGAIEPTNLRFDEGVRLDDGRVALTGFYGGFGSPSYATLAAVYDPATRGLTRFDGDGPGSPAIGPMVAIDGGRLLSVGGRGDTVSDRAVFIDPSTWESRDVGPMLARRSDPTVVSLPDGRVLIVGGAPQSPDRPDLPPPGAELFDPTGVP